MLERIHALKEEALAALEAARAPSALNAVLGEYLGKKGRLQEVLRKLGTLPKEERGPVGREANLAKTSIEAAAEAGLETFRKTREARLGETEWVDPTLPGARRGGGTFHPVSQMCREVEDIFLGMGFELADGPWVEDDFHNFEALNVPKDHPARDLQDTFWLSDGNLLRTHTSPVQVRLMREGRLPIRNVAIGRVFRNEALDATHEHTFHQVEGLMIDREVSVGHMIYVLKAFLREVFHEDVELRLRPDYFPFVEPGFEVDMSFRGDWLELLGCGLVHPYVLEAGGIDPDEYSGFAFGLGIDRLVMLRYAVEDIRHFMSGDLRFLRQFRQGTGA
ncbi:MAG: phenylalanine--tRNA ligase subunit alpha [Planctomycetota bacterium]|jgi:phenylalanyl-tRNA synthetase alpha chain